MEESRLVAYGAGAEFDPQPDRTATRLTIALAWMRARQARDDAFGAKWFFNPAWDILLALYVGYAQGRTECVKNVCSLSSAPISTVGRWIALLEKEGLIGRTVDLADKRRTLLALLPEGLEKMELALDNSAESDARLGLGRLRLVK